jgi:xanthine dehydrogenase accessory factor
MAPDILDLAAQRKSKGEPFALATVVRTVDVTAAKAGAKALIGQDGSISEGWIGGGCARAAVLKAARQALADGKSRLVSIQPKDLLTEQGLGAGDDRDGVTFANNFCPSKGTMDVFVEPILPKPALLVLGASPIAVALADLAANMGFDVTVAAGKDDLARFGPVASKIEGFEIKSTDAPRAYVVVSTQGSGDRTALRAAAALDARYIAFVGSRRKAATLRDELASEGVSRPRLDAIKAPAGLDIGAITTEEIALSIVTEMIAIRRANRETFASSDELAPMASTLQVEERQT